jgi:hypothetical protein
MTSLALSKGPNGVSVFFSSSEDGKRTSFRSVSFYFGYRSGGPGRFPALPEKKVVGLERGSLSHVSTTEELLDRNVADPV